MNERNDPRSVLLHVWLQQAVGICNTASGVIRARFASVKDVYECTDFSFLGTRRESMIKRLMNKNTDSAFEVVKRCMNDNIRIIGLFDGDYPERLKALPDMPVALYAIGDFDRLGKSTAMAVVGTRNASEQGKQSSYELSSHLAEKGVQIISGLALGIDASAHRGAVEANGFTVGVLGCPIGKIYPKENTELYKTLYEKGLVISEHYPSAQSSRGDFPNRNRIISALSDRVTVVEAGERSGALITARYARAQGKPLFALPCQAGMLGVGTSELSALGAVIASDADEIMSKCGFDIKQPDTPHKKPKRVLKLKIKEPDKKSEGEEKKPTPKFSGENSKIIIELLKERPMTTDEIFYRSGLSIREVMIELTNMEIDGIVNSMAGDRYILR